MPSCKTKKRLMPSKGKKCARPSLSRWKPCKEVKTVNAPCGFKVLAGGSGNPAFKKGDIYLDGDAVVTGKLTVTGIIDPPALILEESETAPATPGPSQGMIWLKAGDSGNELMFTNNEGQDTNISSGLTPSVNTVIGGELVVNDESVTDDSKIFLTRVSGPLDGLLGRRVGHLNVSTITAGENFLVKSFRGNTTSRDSDFSSFTDVIFDSSIPTGSSTLTMGSLTVNHPDVTPTSLIILSRQGSLNSSNNIGHLVVCNRTNGSFDVCSYDGNISHQTEDNSDFVWAVINDEFEGGETLITNGTGSLFTGQTSDKILTTRLNTNFDSNLGHINVISVNNGASVLSLDGDSIYQDMDSGDIMWVRIPSV